jgi:hypothetical protein
MIAEYRLYHGAALMEILCHSSGNISVRALSAEGRFASYVINDTVGLHVKHSAARLRPWQFAFTQENADALWQLQDNLHEVFVVLICGIDGMVCLTLQEVRSLTLPGEVDRLWLRVDRRKGHHYSVHGPAGALPSKKPTGLEALAIRLTSPT